MLKISAVIITLNEEQRLPHALGSLSLADEVIVVDSGSTDRTVEAAQAWGARVVSHPWEGYARQKNFAASQANYDWVLSLDADEALSQELAAELREIKEKGPGDIAGFQFPRLARFHGRWIRHCGWYPDFKLRLYDRGRGRWVGDYVHEHVEVDGPVRTVRGDLHHFTGDSFGEQFQRMDRYTTLAAQDSFQRGERWTMWRLILLPPWKFLETYIFRQGFRDALPGFLIAILASRYVFLKYAKLRRIRTAWPAAVNRENSPVSGPAPAPTEKGLANSSH